MKSESFSATRVQAVVADTTLDEGVKALYIGTGGNAIISTNGGQSRFFGNIPSGTVLPIRATRVLSTSLTASDIVALY